jgi:mannose-P-dolichol utilization defect protein 1
MAAVLIAVLAGSAAALFAESVLDMNALSYLQAGAGVLGVASKVPQILAIWQEGGTGQLSAFAVCSMAPCMLSLPFNFADRSRSSTTSPDLFLESSPPSRRWMTS